MERKLQQSLFLQFLKHPFSTGAVCASSPALCREMIGCSSFRNASTFAELGPGTGAVTACILANLPSGADFFSVELNKDVISLLQKRFPGLAIYNESAENLRRIMSERSIRSLDMVISSLPWTIFPGDLQERLLDEILSAMSDDGMFVTYTYVTGAFMPAGIRFHACLKRKFGRVERSSVIWKNMPPAFVYRCRK
ncbi:MAG: hypothetical protein IKB16_02960 [Lentisphaeria bacterium]|nr:hypothetical protein [Lentisphaeria bacterium]